MSIQPKKKVIEDFRRDTETVNRIFKVQGSTDKLIRMGFFDDNYTFGI